VTLITGPQTADNRLTGLEADQLNALVRLASDEHISLFIEADGAHSLPIKAPAQHEPAIPSWVDTVIVVAGLSAIGKPLCAEWVHRPEIFSSLTGLPLGQPITLNSVVTLLMHPRGGLKGIPQKAHKVALLNQTDVHPLSDAEISQLQPLTASYNLILAGSLATDPIHIQQICL
jgi:probable selenium-dependent hydroxylase accessory protein YqeC